MNANGGLFPPAEVPSAPGSCDPLADRDEIVGGVALGAKHAPGRAFQLEVHQAEQVGGAAGEIAFALIDDLQLQFDAQRERCR